MARAPTTFSRVSTGYKDSKNTIAESGYDFSAIDAYLSGTLTGASTISFGGGQATFKGIRSTSNNTFTSNTTIGAGLTVDSLCSFLSNVTIGGGLTVRSNATFQASNVTISGGLTVDSLITANSNFTLKGGLTVDSNATFNSGLTVKGQATAATLLVQSNATFNSNVSAAGGITSTSVLTATGGVMVGAGTKVVAISAGTAAVSLGAIAPLESSSVQTVGLSGATRGDLILITLDSIYPNAAGNTDVVWMASSSSTAGEVHVWGVNSTLTSVTPTAATVVRLVRMNFASYI